MRIVVQRVTHGRVTVGGQVTGQIDHGLVALVGVGNGDTLEQAAWLAERTAHLRIFEDDQGKMNRSVLDVAGSALVVSQFTLYGDTQKGRRPSFVDAAPPDTAEPLVRHYAERLADLGVPVQSGVFRAEMLVEIHNDGPVTILLER